MRACLFVCLSVCACTCVCVCVCVCVSSVFLFVCLSVRLPACLSVCLSITCLSVYLRSSSPICLCLSIPLFIFVHVTIHLLVGGTYECFEKVILTVSIWGLSPLPDNLSKYVLYFKSCLISLPAQRMRGIESLPFHLTSPSLSSILFSSCTTFQPEGW